MSKILNEIIIQNKKIAHTIFSMTVKSDYVSKNAKPGQFVNIKCGDGINALLRRPISICRVDMGEGTFNIVYEVRGEGTAFLSQKRTGEQIDFIGPLGNPFHISERYKKIAVVGGGIGVFPLLFVLQEAMGSIKSAFIGFRSKEYVVLKEDFEKVSEKVLISTDDGSMGYKGFITDMLEKELELNEYDIIYTCGPMPMMKRVVSTVNRRNIKCQVSMEQRMGCGIGACLVCACKTKRGDDWQYSHVCKDGPVFWSEEIIWEDRI
ncbi:MAG: dihydroorotate dehydrogenase electron transfer subunit [Acetivibrionales bacterium]